MFEHYFSISEANALIPILQGQLEQLQRLQRIAQEKFEEMERLKQVGKDASGHFILGYDLKLAKEVFDRAVAEANELIRAVNESGCQLRNIEMGLIDFPARVDGEDVLLCWQVGEPEVLFFHSTHAGFQGRKPLTTGESAGNSGEDPKRTGY